jgi:hypothetical protein
MREGESVVKQIESFWSLLEKMSVAKTLVINEDALLSLMKSMPLSYKAFITSMWRHPNITL